MRRMNAAFLAALLALATTPASVSADPLPGTQPLTDSRDLARVMVDGIHAYLDRELKDAPKKRDELWKGDAGTKEALTKSLPEKRERLKKVLGVVDQRVPPKLEFVSGPNQPSLLADINGCKIHAVRWAVLNGLDAEGLLIEPKATPIANVIAIPHAGQIPEELAGLKRGDYFGLELARNRCRVLIPMLIDRDDKDSGNARMNRWTNQPHREFIHRMAYEMGRTLTGFEVQKVLAAVDWFRANDRRDSADSLPIGVIGYGDGGMIAMYAGAIDERIRATQTASYFGSRENMWYEPIDRSIWNRMTEFGDAEIGLMMQNRGFCPDVRMRETKWSGPIQNRNGRSGATPGQIKKIEGETEEVRRWSQYYSPLRNSGRKFEPTHGLVSGGFIHLKMDISKLLYYFGESRVTVTSEGDDELPIDTTKTRHKRQFDQLVAYCQNLWRNSEPVRKEFWKKADASSPEAWEKSCDWYREYFHDEIIGRLPKPTMPLNPKSRPIYDTPKWTGHEVTLDVYPNVMAYGILLLPKDLKPGERRPVVVCQHGLEGRPTDVCNPKEKTKYYLSFGAQLADKGYIVFAPQNPYIFDDHFRQILRKANPLKLSLFSFIIRQHERILDWLETQPHVDPKRIAFYGLSYGGKTAMRVPAVEKRYCLSICSGDFNEWIGKIVSTELPMSYMYTKEYDMLEFNLGHTFNYAEMAYMIAPRPFMVERGHDDGVGIDEMVAYEYAKVRYLYANKLKIPDRTAIEFFPGGHQINGKGTFDFLQKHLAYP